METGQAMNREFARRTEMVLAAQAKGIPKKKRALVAIVAVEAISAMLFLAARQPRMAKPVVAETKLLLRRYLSAYAT
jgi:hypothetical protein